MLFSIERIYLTTLMLSLPIRIWRLAPSYFISLILCYKGFGSDCFTSIMTLDFIKTSDMNHDSQLNLDCVISSCFLFPSLFFEIPTGFYIISIILRNPFVILFSPVSPTFFSHCFLQYTSRFYSYLLLFIIIQYLYQFHHRCVYSFFFQTLYVC